MLPITTVTILSLTGSNSYSSLSPGVSLNALPDASPEPRNSLPVETERGVRSAFMIEDDGIFNSDCQNAASKLSIPLSSQIDTDEEENYTHALSLVPYEFEGVSTYALSIDTIGSADIKQKRRKRSNKKSKSNPHFIDFCPPKNSRMGKRSGKESGTDLLVKAAIPKKSANTVIWDLTAGFGQDSLILALNGASRVHMVERDPFVFALLEDGLRRLSLLSSVFEFASDLKQRLSLEAGDGIDMLQTLLEDDNVERPDVCYLDPMFPPRTKSASVKKPMQILHGLLSTQEEAIEAADERIEEERRILECALAVARCRVVVKRPARAPLLGGESAGIRKPSYAVEGSVNRWDVYILNNE